MRTTFFHSVPAMLLAACSTTSPPDDVGAACDAEAREVSFSTSDGLTLVADHHPAPSAGAPAVVLFHMIPPSNDRTGWPPRVRRRLAALGLTVLNVDRRGAGDSEGEPQDAYEGPGGRRDAEAAVRFLTSDAARCPVDPTRIALLGASNGTTTVLDYAAAHEADLPDPAALGFLSPGAYTENQHAIADVQPADRPWLWLFPTNEPWSLGFRDDAPVSWTFTERGEAHGTRMFDGGDLEDATVSDLTAFLQDALQP